MVEDIESEDDADTETQNSVGSSGDLRRRIEEALKASETTSDFYVFEEKRSKDHSDVLDGSEQVKMVDDGNDKLARAVSVPIEPVKDRETVPVEAVEGRESDLQIGDYVETTLKSKNVCKGYVHFVGKTDFASGVWIGIYLDQKLGKNDGTVKNKAYFCCPKKYGIFKREDDVKVLSRFKSGASTINEENALQIPLSCAEPCQRHWLKVVYRLHAPSLVPKIDEILLRNEGEFASLFYKVAKKYAHEK